MVPLHGAGPGLPSSTMVGTQLFVSNLPELAAVAGKNPACREYPIRRRLMPPPPEEGGLIMA